MAPPALLRATATATLCGLIGLMLTVAARPASADVGYRDASFRDLNGVQTPSEDKPQSKLWFQDGSWWGLLYSTSVHATTIHRLDSGTETWLDTGTVVDSRRTARGDALWDGSKLYVVSGTTVISEFSNPPNPDDVSSGSADLSRYSYNPLTKAYTLDPGFPVSVNHVSTESVSLAKASDGRLWVTYTQVAPDNSNQVYVNHSVGSDATWGTPYALPATAASVHYDDVSAIVAYQGGKIGVMWSNQLTRKFYLSTHPDGAADSSWTTEVAYGGGVGGCSTGCANDHVNVKELSSDGSGRLFAAVKTANRQAGQAFVSLLVRDRHGAWTSHYFGAVEELHTRPMVVIDEEHREVFMFAVSPEVGGTIYYKKSSLDNVSFPPGAGTPFMQSALDTDISNPTTTKQSVNTGSGLVALADANTHAMYWHNSMSLAGEPAPAPAAPTDTAVAAPSANTDTSLRVTWSDNSANEDGFKVERKTGSGAYGQIATVGGGVTSYTDTGLNPGDTYTYRVRAFNAVGDSGYSDEASETTAQTGPVRTFTTVEDAYVDSAAQDAKNGTKGFLYIDGSPIQEAYVKFRLSGLAGNTVTSAKLRMYVTDNGSVKGGSVAKMTDTSWSEPAVTYRSRPVIDGSPLATLGAVGVGTWYEFGVTPAVQGDGTLSLGLKTSSTDAVHYASREEGAHAPQLVVTVTPGDTIPPQTTIASGPSGTVTTAAASFSLSSSETGSTFECRLDPNPQDPDEIPWAGCTSPKQYANLADGTHTFEVRATDAVGNVDATPATRTWTVDTIPPSTLVDPSVPAVTKSASVSFSLSADEPNVTFECSLDGSAYAGCTSPKQYSGLADGTHTFKARATDAVGNREADPMPIEWTVDTRSPATAIDTGPQGAATSTSATFTFSSDETGSTFECSLDSAPYDSCTSPQQYTGLVDGPHTFAVRATDAAGNVDASPPSRSWTIDTTSPDTTPPTAAVTVPAADGQAVAGRVTLSADAADDVAVDHVDFLVDGSVIATDGTSPYGASWNSAGVADGPVTITARAVDTSSNATTSDGRTATVDNTAPDTAIDSGPQGATPSASASLAFSSSDASATFECSLDGSAYATCTSPQQLTGLSDGAHTFKVRARDPVDNVDATPATLAWTVDTAAPDTSINSGPSGTVNNRSASLGFSSNETGSTFKCSLDGAAFASCTSPKQYTALSDGAHIFEVQAIDAAGNDDASPAARSWTVDPVVFSDGLESGGFSNWTQPAPHTAIDGSGAVQTSIVKSGSFAAELISPSSTSYSYLRKTLSASQSDVTVSGDFRISAEGASGQEVPFFKLYDSGSVRLVYVNRRNVSGRVYVTCPPSTATVATPVKLALGTWAHVTVHAIATGSGTSTVDVTMDGVLIFHTTTASLGTSGVRTIQIGNDKQLPFGLYADNLEARI